MHRQYQTYLSKMSKFQGRNSFFFTFEGIEGAGKSSHITKLKDDLERAKIKVLLLREPGGTDFGEKLRSAILESKTKIEPISESYLFAASRAQLLKEKILPFLNEPNSVVICDRYIDSSIAYQGVARGVGIENILAIHNHYPLNILPNLSFYIKISLETSYKRQEIRNLKKDYFESENSKFYTQLINGYDLASEIFNERIKIIDGEQSIDAVYKDIHKQVFNLLNIKQ